MRISDWSSDVCSSDLLARGRHPEAEMGRYLTDAGYANIAPLLGEVTQVEADGASTVLAVVQGYVHNQGDAWSWTLHLLAREVQGAVMAATSSSIENRRRWEARRVGTGCV